MDEKDLTAVRTLLSMCTDALIGKVDKETFISNLRLFANGMEYGDRFEICDNCNESYVLSVYTACPVCHVKSAGDVNWAQEAYDEFMREIHR